MNKAPKSTALKQLIQAFEVSEEAKSYIVAPPSSPGFVYEFGEPYFHAHNQLILKKPMSEELNILVSALATGLTVHIALFTQLKNKSNGVMFSPEDLERHSLVLGSGIHLHTDNGVQGWQNHNGPGTFVGLRTELGIFPVVRIGELAAEVFKQRQYSLENYSAMASAYGSVYHHGMAVAAAIIPSWSVPSAFREIRPPAPTMDLSVSDENALGELFSTTSNFMEISPKHMENLIDAYQHRTRNVDNLTKEDLAARCRNLNMELDTVPMTWKSFVKGMKVLGFESLHLTMNARHAEGEIRSHAIDVRLED
jgi:hypothetical protein